MRYTRSIGMFLVLASASAESVRPQAVTNPNQITGLVELSATDPRILDVLRQGSGLGQGFADRAAFDEIRAASLGGPPDLSAGTSIRVLRPALRQADYDLTVESSDMGIRYRVAAEMWLDETNDVYRFAPQDSDPVFSEPAPDVVLNLSECPGLVQIAWTDGAGNPFSVAGGFIRAHRESVAGSGIFDELQAEVRSIGAGPSAEYLAVRGGARFRIEAHYLVQFGSDPFTDLVVLERRCDFEVDVACDEVVPLACACDGSGPASGSLARIVGEVDVLGEAEVPYDLGPVFSRTLVTAYDGPHENRRMDSLLEDPAQGPYLLPNMLPGTPPYKVKAEACFGRGDDFQTMKMPELGAGSNPRVDVASGMTTDLGRTFVMDPGTVSGKVELAGPRPGAFGSFFESIVRPLHGDPDALPGVPLHDDSFVFSTGTDDIATGAIHSAAGGEARTGFAGGVDDSGRNFDGVYRLRLGGLDEQAASWTTTSLHVEFFDAGIPGEPASYRRSTITARDRARGDVLVAPGAAIGVDHRYCFSDVNLGFISTTGTFFEPRLSAAGSHIVPSIPGRDDVYAATAWGTPLDVSDASDRGLVTMALPQGNYTVLPVVTSLSPRGRESTTELPPLSFPVGCRQKLSLVPGLVPVLDELPECTPDPIRRISGSISSDLDVTRLAYRLNGSAEVDLCAPCGVSPSFAFDVIWQPCENEITVIATDADDRVASVTGFTSLDGEPPLVTTRRFSVWPPNHRYACFTDVAKAVQASDNCPGPLRTELIACTSDQPDDQQGPAGAALDGDGSTRHDCVLSDDRMGACIRAERLAQCPAGRTYSAQLRVTDACGLSTDVAVQFHVPHDEQGAALLDPAGPEARLGPHGEPPFEWTPADDPDAGLPQPFTCDGARASRPRSPRARLASGSSPGAPSARRGPGR